MAKYIKSHSNFVVKSKHQDLQSSTIWERDITTIGGVDQYAKGQTPIYKSGNFIITVNNDGTYARDISRTKWSINSSSGDTWTQTAIDAINSGETFNEEDDLIIKPKQDYYDLRDFAYYGSCTELIRGSINGIIQNFPGELYCDGLQRTLAYYSGNTLVTFGGDENPISGHVNNPFLIDIYSAQVGDVENVQPLHYFCNEGYKNYEIVTDDDVTDITTYSVTYTENPQCPGNQIASVTINDYTLNVYLGNGGMFYYFCDSTTSFHIRPKRKFFVQFYNSLATFQKLLLNLDSTPLYKATFRIIHENSYGYYTNMESFEFPKDAGGYNLSTSEESYNPYIQRLLAIGSCYDEYFSDNLWRSMTHESIKNFDWSYKREYVDGDDEEYIAGGNKIQKMIRLYAREFDECKAYIDSIQNTNTLTYNERSNLPDYFLTDIVESDGWDVHLVYPLKYTTPNHYEQVSENIIQPYFSESKRYGYFPTCDCENIEWLTEPSNSSKFDEDLNKLVTLVRPYIDQQTYTYRKINSEFFKRLKLNSKAILRHKGTIEGVEMLLAMFGLKSKRWVDRIENARISACSTSDRDYDYDYEIIEYTSLIDAPIEELWDKLHDEYRIDWVNSTKLINYQYTKDGINYIKYQGLPLSYRDFVGEANVLKKDGADIIDFEGNPVQKRRLYPHFESSTQLDGNPYYQMNGGWESKTFDGTHFQFDREDNYVSASTKSLYHNTLRDVHCVDNLSKLLQLQQDKLHDGSIYYVYDLNDNVCAIDGYLYEISEDEYSINNTACIGYVDLVVSNSTIYLGDQEFTTSIVVYNNIGEEEIYYLDNYNDGSHIKAYIWNNNSEFAFIANKNNSESITSFGVFKYHPEEDYTHYFYLQSVEDWNRLSLDDSNIGWIELKSTDDIYKEANISYNYLLGNNPHYGGSEYDGGYEYMHYFERLFNYALDKELIDERCYGNDYYYSITEEIPSYGFSGLTNGLSVKDIPDHKIHCFAHLYADSGETMHVYSDESELLDGANTYKQLLEITNKEFNNHLKKVSSYTLGTYSEDEENSLTNDLQIYAASVDDANVTSLSDGSENRDQITDQIVNNKHVSLKFYLPVTSETAEEEQMACLKYYDSVILPYVETMIPSTVILDVSYDYKTTKDKYIITWMHNDGKGTVTKTYVNKGEAIGNPPTPTKDHYEFKGWNGKTNAEIAAIVPTGDMTFVASYELATYIVTFKDVDGNGGEVQLSYPYGTHIYSSAYPETSMLSDKVFNGWSQNDVVVTGNTTITANWANVVSTTYTVTFNDATSAPTVYINGKSVIAKPSGSNYVATYTITEKEDQVPASVTATWSGGLPANQEEYDISLNGSTSWNLSDSTSYTYSVDAITKTTSSKWGQSSGTVSKNGNLQVNATTTASATTSQAIVISMPGSIQNNAQTHTLSTSSIYDADKENVVFAHPKDTSKTASITIIAAEDSVTTTSEMVFLEWKWNGTDTYSVDGEGGNITVMNAVSNKLMATGYYKTRTITSHSDPSKKTEYSDWSEQTITSNAVSYSSNPSTLSFDQNTGTSTVTKTAIITANAASSDIKAATNYTSSTYTVTFVEGIATPYTIHWVNTVLSPESDYTTTKVYKGKTITPPSTNPTTTGRQFVGWSKTDGGTTPVSDFGTATGETSFYTIWSETSYEFYFTNEQKTSWNESAESTATTLAAALSVTSSSNGEACGWFAAYDGSVEGVTFTADTENNTFNITVPVNTDKSSSKSYSFKLTQENSGKVITLTFTQTAKDLILVMCDYLTLTYSWDNTGQDLDTATILKYPSIYGSTNPVGMFGDSSNPYLIFAGDNTTSGDERVLVKIKDLKSYLDGKGVSWWSKNLPQNADGDYYAQLDVYANWFVSGDSNTNVTIKIDSNSGATSVSVDAAMHTVTFTGGETKEVVGATPVTVNACSFANANKLSTYVEKAYTKVAEIRYYVEKGVTAIITNQNEACNFKDKIGAHIDYFTLSSDDNYFVDCTMARGLSTFKYYNNYTGKTSGEEFPSEGCTTGFKLNIKINGRDMWYTIATNPDTSAKSNYKSGSKVPMQIVSTTATTSTGTQFLTDCTGSIVDYPWIQFQVGNHCSTYETKKTPHYTSTINGMWQKCTKAQELNNIKLHPGILSYILYDQTGKWIRTMGVHTDQFLPDDQIFGLTVDKGTCTDVTVSVKSGDAAQYKLTPSTLNNVTAGSYQYAKASVVSANNSANWRKWAVQCSTTDKNYDPNNASAMSPAIYQEGTNQLRVYTDAGKTTELTGYTQLDAMTGIVTSSTFCVDTMQVFFKASCSASSPSAIKLYFNRPVVISGVTDHINANNVDYSQPVQTLDLKCITNYSSTKSGWTIKITDDSYTITLNLYQNSK